jgi:hypothetical protein
MRASSGYLEKKIGKKGYLNFSIFNRLKNEEEEQV